MTEDRQKCPKCGCTEVERTGNMAEYPEHWERFNCANCGFLVGVVDNSPYISCHDFENYVIEV